MTGIVASASFSSAVMCDASSPASSKGTAAAGLFLLRPPPREGMCLPASLSFWSRRSLIPSGVTAPLAYASPISVMSRTACSSASSWLPNVAAVTWQSGFFCSTKTITNVGGVFLVSIFYHCQAMSVLRMMAFICAIDLCLTCFVRGGC